jgi:cell division protein FtsB
MKSFFQKKYMLTLGGLLFAVGLFFMFFGESGLWKYMKLKNELKGVQMEIEQTENENKALQNEIDSVKNKVPAKIERVAREKHNMIRKNETVIDVIEK